MEQIVKTVGATETKYTDVSEDAKGVGMTRVGWVRQAVDYRGRWIATRFYAGTDATRTFATREQAERWIESTLDDGSLIATITVR